MGTTFESTKNIFSFKLIRDMKDSWLVITIFIYWKKNWIECCLMYVIYWNLLYALNKMDVSVTLKQGKNLYEYGENRLNMEAA